MYIDPLEIVDFRCHRPRQATVLHPECFGGNSPTLTSSVGDNGTGKTSVLRGGAGRAGPRAGLLGVRSRATCCGGAATLRRSRRRSSPTRPTSRDFPRRSSSRREISPKARCRGVEDGGLFAAIGTTSHRENSAAFFLVGYGASRRIDLSEAAERSGLKKMRGVRFQRVRRPVRGPRHV